MNNSIKQHLDSITIENIEFWQKDTFSVYASSTNSNKMIQLGIDGFGKFCVCINRETKHSFETIDKAIAKYHELLIN